MANKLVRTSMVKKCVDLGISVRRFEKNARKTRLKKPNFNNSALVERHYKKWQTMGLV